MKKVGVRISGGTLRGRSLAVPPGARPTEARVREALFSIWGPALEGARFLDLFAGSGAVAVEALGRGALGASCVESDRRALEMLHANLDSLGLAGVVDVYRGLLPEVLTDLNRSSAGPFDLIFADPPYGFGDHETLLGAAAPLLAADGEIALEHSTRRETPVTLALAPHDLARTGRRRYGETALSFYRREC